jgi:beta-galactosidase GanA
MGFLSNDYRVTIKESSALWKEYSDILEIAKSLKNNMKWSNKDEKSFDELMARVATAFKNQTAKRSTKLSTPNTQCATDVLKAHVDHERV